MIFRLIHTTNSYAFTQTPLEPSFLIDLFKIYDKISYMSIKHSKIYERQAKTIRDRLAGRDYVLGLDLGVGSIGLAAVAVEAVEDTGTRIVPKDIVFSLARTFKASDGAAERRQFRSQRNSLRHKRNRLKKLWKILSEKGLMLAYTDSPDKTDPSISMFSENTRRKNPYDLRLMGLSERLEPEELGYAIYHIANHRGSSSVFGEEEKASNKREEKEDDLYRKAKKQTEELLKQNENLKTYIELLYISNSQSSEKCWRNTNKTSDKTVPLPTRDLIENEFDKLIETQARLNKNLDEAYIVRIKDAVFFENEMLIPEPGNCPYFPNEKLLPKLSFINEERRLWEAVNNIRFSIVQFDTYNFPKKEKFKLTGNQRTKIFEYLNNGNSLQEKKFRSFLKDFGFKEDNIEDIALQGSDKKNQKIEGFRYCKLRENPIFKNLSEENKERVIETYQKSTSKEKLISALTDLLSSEDLNDLIQVLPPKPTQGYAMCGKKAMKIVIEYLIKYDGMTWHEAEEQALRDEKLPKLPTESFSRLPYYGQVIPTSVQRIMGKAWHSGFDSSKKGFHKPNTDPLEEKYGKIANPVVHQTMNELRKVINELLDIFGKKPVQINVEVSRELKVGKDKRDSIAKENRNREKRNKELFEIYCEPHELKRSDVRKFRIWKDQAEICPYCLKEISPDDIVNGRADLDHIFPRSDVPGDPENNLVVAHKTCNEKEKGQRTPYMAFSGNKEKWNSILQNAKENLKSKAWRFEMSNEKYSEWKKKHSMSSRFESDNAYIAIIARKYLSCLYSEEELKHLCVDTNKGSETAMLRKAWDLQGLTFKLGNLHIKKQDIEKENNDPDAKSEAETQTNKPENSEKVRADARHHALDAIVIAYASKGMIRKINTMSARNIPYITIQEMLSCPPVVSEEDQKRGYSFKNYIENVLMNETFVCVKQNHSRNGALLKNTNYSIYACETNGESIVYGSWKKIKDLNPNKDLKKQLYLNYELKPWFTQNEKNIIEKILKNNNAVYERICNCLESLKNNNTENKKEAELLKTAFSQIGGKYRTINNGTASKMFVSGKPSDSHPGQVIDTGDNFAIDLFYDENNKLKGEIIRKIDAINEKFVPEYQRKGFRKIGSIHPGDVLEVDMNVNDITKVRTANAKKDRSYIRITTFTYTSNKSNIQVKYRSICNTNTLQEQGSSFLLESTFKNYKPRLVTLSPCGLTKYASKELW